jgi:hypothetical protein
MSYLKPGRQRRDLHKSNLPVTSRKIGLVLINLGHVSHDSGLVEALSEHVYDKGAWRYMVTFDAPMDVLQ